MGAWVKQMMRIKEYTYDECLVMCRIVKSLIVYLKLIEHCILIILELK